MQVLSIFDSATEPNTAKSESAYAANASLYAAIASAVGPAVHAAAPNSSFVGPASGNIGIQSGWLQRIFEAGVLQYFDKVTIHPYRSDDPETVRQDLQQVVVVVVSVKVPNLHIEHEPNTRLTNATHLDAGAESGRRGTFKF